MGIPIPLTSLVVIGLRADRPRVRGMASALVSILRMFSACALLLFSTPAFAIPILAQANDRSLVVVRGHAVCLNSLGQDAESFLGCNDANHYFGFETRSGKLYKFAPSDPMTPIFTDSRVRQRELQISARLHSGDQLEIIKIQSVKDGRLYDVYYFCQVCNITAYVPGLCPCCRAELEFRETPP